MTPLQLSLPSELRVLRSGLSPALLIRMVSVCLQRDLILPRSLGGCLTASELSTDCSTPTMLVLSPLSPCTFRILGVGATKDFG